MLSKRGMSREAKGRRMYEKERKRYYRIRRRWLHNICVNTKYNNIYESEKELLLIKKDRKYYGFKMKEDEKSFCQES